MFIKGKKAKHFRHCFIFGEGDNIFCVYHQTSYAKIQAIEKCREKCVSQDGYGFNIMSHNSFGFTCGWLTTDGLKTTLHVETFKNSYEMVF